MKPIDLPLDNATSARVVRPLPRLREFVLDLPRRAERIFNRSDQRDLCTAQVFGVVEAFADCYHLEPALAEERLRWCWIAALRACGKARA